MSPLVSCILATRNRPQFLAQAISYFLRQRYANKELIIVDDSAEPAAVPESPQITYLRLNESTTLGAKLNLGIASARGELIQKLDDDDYYHPDFLSTTVRALQGQEPLATIVGCDCFLVLSAASGELTFSGHGWCAGGTLCFYRQLWQRQAFRELPRAVDWWFLKDHAPQRVKLTNPELYILVRHGAGHLWNTLGNSDVSEYFRRQRPYARRLNELLPVEDRLFYERLRV
ncbi:MAG: glycosyltransferase family 2 protein [Chloroflexales bacterium]|nr:glycosyltransferase family 2 protein [Chloroflexales bacterium]